MKLGYRKLGDFIQQVNNRNSDLSVTNLIGVTLDKCFIPSVANTVGADMSKYKVINKGQFACKLMSVGRDKKLPVSYYTEDFPSIVSSAYYVFEIMDNNDLLDDYLMMWFRRPETDRYLGFISGGDVRGSISWDDLCTIEIKVPDKQTQQEIVNEYNTVTNRIKLNEQLNQKLEETAQALYKHWFVDFEFPNKEGEPYKSSGGEMVYNEELDKDVPVGWEVKSLNEISKISMGQSPSGDSYNDCGIGTPLINGPVEFGDYFTVKSKWTTSPKKYCKNGDLILCVRGSTVGRYVISDGKYSIGRGVCAINSVYQNFTEFLIKVNLSEILKDVTGSTFPNLDRKTIENYRVLVSNYDVLNYFENTIKPLTDLAKEQATMNIYLTELKEVLLSMMSKVEINKVLL